MTKYLFTIATKNLFRNKLRSSVSIGAIVIAVCVIVLLRGLLTGIVGSYVSTHIEYEAGHIKIVDQDYAEKERLLPLNETVDGFTDMGLSEMVQNLEKMEGVERAIPRLKFGAMASYNEKTVGLLGWGVDPEDEMAFTDLKSYIVEGRMIEKGQREAVLGVDLLENLGLEVGDKLTLLYSTSFGSFKGSTFKIVGKIESQLKLLDDVVVYVPIDQAQRMLDMPDMTTELLLVTPNQNLVGEYMSQVKDFFAEHDPNNKYLLTAWNKSDGLIQYIQIAKGIYNLIYVFILLLASFVIINTMIMIVKERTQEIGMMTSLGLKGRDILWMFVLEATAMGLIGSFIGAILGGIGTKILSIVGLDYSEAFADIGAKVMIKPVFYPVVSFENMLFCFVLGVLVTALTSIIPARRAANLNPTEAMRSH